MDFQDAPEVDCVQPQSDLNKIADAWSATKKSGDFQAQR